MLLNKRSSSCPIHLSLPWGCSLGPADPLWLRPTGENQMETEWTTPRSLSLGCMHTQPVSFPFPGSSCNFPPSPLPLWLAFRPSLFNPDSSLSQTCAWTVRCHCAHKKLFLCFEEGSRVFFFSSSSSPFNKGLFMLVSQACSPNTKLSLSLLFPNARVSTSNLCSNESGTGKNRAKRMAAQACVWKTQTLMQKRFISVLCNSWRG